MTAFGIMQFASLLLRVLLTMLTENIQDSRTGVDNLWDVPRTDTAPACILAGMTESCLQACAGLTPRRWVHVDTWPDVVIDTVVIVVVLTGQPVRADGLDRAVEMYSLWSGYVDAQLMWLLCARYK